MPALRADTLARFVDALPIPRVLQPREFRADPEQPGVRIPHYRVVMQQHVTQLHRDLPATRAFCYEGSFPGPTFEARTGQPMLIEWVNALPQQHLLPIDHSLHGAHAAAPDVRAVVHVHGARVPPESDGYPESWLAPGASLIARYPMHQEAATLWYHDHAMGIERLNQYAGLFGMFLVRDALEDRLQLPSGRHEIPLLLCDRLLDRDGQLRYPVSSVANAPWVSEVYGDAMLVNGKIQPVLEVEARPYRFRVVNASNARFFYLSLSSGLKFQQIGSDQGLLAAPVTLDKLTLAPGERADLVVDFSIVGGAQIVLQSQALELMQFRVAVGEPKTVHVLPKRLRTIERLAPARARQTRQLTLNEYEEPGTHRMLMLLNGSYWRQPVTETVQLGSIEIWSLLNLTEDTHPIHLHLVRFQILDRQRFDADEYLSAGQLSRLGEPLLPAENEAGWKDTVRAEPGSITRIIVHFEGYVGRYVWHCHVLEHAANEMMRPFDVVAEI